MLAVCGAVVVSSPTPQDSLHPPARSFQEGEEQSVLMVDV